MKGDLFLALAVLIILRQKGSFSDSFLKVLFFGFKSEGEEVFVFCLNGFVDASTVHG